MLVRDEAHLGGHRWEQAPRKTETGSVALLIGLRLGLDTCRFIVPHVAIWVGTWVISLLRAARPDGARSVAGIKPGTVGSMVVLVPVLDCSCPSDSNPPQPLPAGDAAGSGAASPCRPGNSAHRLPNALHRTRPARGPRLDYFPPLSTFRPFIRAYTAAYL